ncbi:hypothetical protein [Paraburkholderia sp. GAS334]|jgi:hypothetical protein
MNNATTASATANTSWFARFRALAVDALNMHLQTCAIVAEALRRPQ